MNLFMRLFLLILVWWSLQLSKVFIFKRMIVNVFIIAIHFLLLSCNTAVLCDFCSIV